MNKHGFIGLICTVLAVLMASTAFAALEISGETTSLAGTNGDTPTGSFDVTNTGGSAVSDVHSTDTHPYGIGYVPDGFGLAAGATETVDFTVTIPADAKVGSYQGIVTAEDNLSQTDTFILTVEVQDNGLGLVKSSDPTPLTTDSGLTIEGSFSVENERNDDITATLSGVLTKGSDELTITGKQVTLPYLTTTTVTFQIAVPDSAPAGTYVGDISLAYGSDTLIAAATVTVNPTAIISVADVSQNILPGDSESATITIHNTGNVDVAGLGINYTASDFRDNDGDELDLSFSPMTGIDIAAGGSATVTVTADAPTSLDRGTYSGTVTVTDSAVQDTFTLSFQTLSVLRIGDVTLTSEGKDVEVRPGEEFEVEVEVENVADEIDVENIVVTVWFENGGRLEDDEGDDLEDESDEFDLDEGDEETVVFSFIMPYGVEDGDDYTIHVEAEGRNADDRTQRIFDEDDSETIEVVKEKHEIVYDHVALRSSTLACERTTSVEVTVRNTGQKDEDVELMITNDDFDIEIIDFFTLDADYDDDENEYDGSYAISVPSGTKKGEYELEVRAYYDDGDKYLSADLSLTVGDCRQTTPTEDQEEGEEQEEVEEQEEGMIVITPPSKPGEGEVIVKPPIEVTEEAAATNGYLWLLIIADAVLLASIVAVIWLLLRKR
ncbi:hypothetical protein JXB02_04850 [Candidatus Woesearchaeota archaeon]|nr:hypothetical protein [Candidatus Woesearchaeota archaeon]